jgi:hypothetical protein
LLAHQPPLVTSSSTLLQAYNAAALYVWTIKSVAVVWLIVVACAVGVAGTKMSSILAPLPTSLSLLRGFRHSCQPYWIGCRGRPLLSWESACTSPFRHIHSHSWDFGRLYCGGGRSISSHRVVATQSRAVPWFSLIRGLSQTGLK